MKSKQDIRFELNVNIFLVVFAIVYNILTRVGIDTSRLFLQGNAGLNPRTFPYFVGAVFVITAFYMLVRSFFQYRKVLKEENLNRAKGIEVVEERKKPFPFPVKAALIPYGIFISYIVTLKLFGFFFDTILLSLVMLFYLNKKNRIRNIIFSILFPLFVFLVFNKLLGVRLPIGYIFGAKW
jgi:putative tricarboxylic transport membrane protein